MKNIPGGGVVPFFLLRICHSSLATGLKFFLFTFFRTLLRVFAFMQSSTPFFSNAFSLFAKKKHPAWGQTKNGGALPAVMGASAERAYRLQERRSSTVLRSLRMLPVLRSPRISNRLTAAKNVVAVQSSGGGGGGGTFVRNFPRCPCSMV